MELADLEVAEWQLQSAKARFSELFRLVLHSGPQRVTRGGKESVVIISVKDYDALVRRAQQNMGLAEFFATSPLASADLDLERPLDYGRDIEL